MTAICEMYQKKPLRYRSGSIVIIHCSFQLAHFSFLMTNNMVTLCCQIPTNICLKTRLRQDQTKYNLSLKSFDDTTINNCITIKILIIFKHLCDKMTSNFINKYSGMEILDIATYSLKISRLKYQL